MKVTEYLRALVGTGAILLCMFTVPFCWVHAAEPVQKARIWARDNLVAWEAAPLDVAQRTPDQRAQMLQRLDIKRYAYLSSTNAWDIPNDINTSHFDIDAEIKAMLKHGIHIQAWYFWLNSDDPATDPKILAALAAFKRYNIRPQLWVSQSHKDYPKPFGDLADQMSRYLNADVTVPRTIEEYENLPEPQKKQVISAWTRARNEFLAADFPKTAADQRKRIEREAARIEALVKLSEPYGCQVNLYNHREWFGTMDHQIAILERLKERNVVNVGIIYNFSHSRDAFHDDYPKFAQVWDRIQPYVSQVNITGRWSDYANCCTYLSQGTRELDMMRTIQNSGWTGTVGILVRRKGDTEAILKRELTGLDWLAAELSKPGSGGARPVFPPEK